LEIDPKSSETRFNYGVAKIKNEDVEGAKQEWETVLKHEPGEPNATAALAILNEWTEKAKENKSDGKAETKAAIKKIASLNAPSAAAAAAAAAEASPPQSPPLAPAAAAATTAGKARPLTLTKKHGIQDPATLLTALDKAEAALRAMDDPDFPSGEDGGEQPEPPRRKSVFAPQAPSQDTKRTYVRDISAAPDGAAAAQQKKPPMSSAALAKSVALKAPAGDSNAAGLASALAKLDEELAAKGAPRRGSVVQAQIPSKPSPTYKDPKQHKFSYADLKASKPPEGVDPSCRQVYLSDEEFSKVFGKTEKEFVEMPLWKQTRDKKRVGLF
jgi:hypothetical protein